MAENGDGAPLDLKEAVTWYRRGAEAGNVHSMMSLAWLRLASEPALHQSAEGQKWLAKAAEKGLPEAISWYAAHRQLRLVMPMYGERHPLSTRMMPTLIRAPRMPPRARSLRWPRVTSPRPLGRPILVRQKEMRPDDSGRRARIRRRASFAMGSPARGLPDESAACLPTGRSEISAPGFSLDRAAGRC